MCIRDSVLPAGIAVAGLFLIGCFISLSMGTSMGTIAALTPIAVGISEKTGFSMAVSYTHLDVYKRQTPC